MTAFPNEYALAIFFTLLNWVALITVLFLVFKYLRYAPRTGWALTFWAVPFTLLTFPVHSNMMMGQINMFLLLLIIFDALVLSGTRFSGITAAIAASIKMTPAVLIIYFIAKRDWSGTIRFVSTGIILIGLSFVIHAHTAWEFFTHTVFESSRVGAIQEPLSFNIMGEVFRIFPQPFNALAYAVVAIPLIVTCYLSLRVLVQQKQELGAICVAGFLMLMISPISWNHHWVWIIPALIYCVVQGYRTQDSVLLYLAVAGSVLFTYRFEAWFSGHHWQIGEWSLYAVAMHALPELWTIAFIVYPWWKDRRRQATPQVVSA